MTPLPFPSAKKPPCALVAGNLTDAENYAAEKRLTDWFFVASAEQLIGELHIEYVGMSWRRRRDRDEIYAAINRLDDEGLLR